MPLPVVQAAPGIARSHLVLAQARMRLPKSLTGVFQGLLLFTLLACDTLVNYRLKWVAEGVKK